MPIDSLAGRIYGPVELRVCPERVREFVDVTGDDLGRWVDAAPPGFAAVLLFAVAPLLLDDEEIQAAARSVIHGDQAFEWHRAIPMDETLEITGTIARVRTRNEVHFVSFGLHAGAGDGPVVHGTSTFLMSPAGAPAGGADVQSEPAPDDRGEVPHGWVAASRSDLIRYAGATRDWNPVHWDHASAVAAGLPGVVVHGLLQTAWVCAHVGRDIAGDRPLASARFRFRSPLRPAIPVRVQARQESLGGIAADLVGRERRYLTSVLEQVTP